MHRCLPTSEEGKSAESHVIVVVRVGHNNVWIVEITGTRMLLIKVYFDKNMLQVYWHRRTAYIQFDRMTEKVADTSNSQLRIRPLCSNHTPICRPFQRLATEENLLVLVDAKWQEMNSNIAIKDAVCLNQSIDPAHPETKQLCSYSTYTIV